METWDERAPGARGDGDPPPQRAFQTPPKALCGALSEEPRASEALRGEGDTSHVHEEPREDE